MSATIDALPVSCAETLKANWSAGRFGLKSLSFFVESNKTGAADFELYVKANS